MELNITNYEYFRLLLSYPFINTSKLVRINSRIKYPNVCELMENNDYIIYKKQQDDINYYNTQIIDCLKNNENNKLMKKKKFVKHI